MPRGEYEQKPLIQIDSGRLIELYNAGLSLNAIARRLKAQGLKISDVTVRQRLIAAGVTMRHGAAAQRENLTPQGRERSNWRGLGRMIEEKARP